jgi:DNA polymerase-3 subunit alpha
LNGYHTAYYKKHFPAAFMAAVLKSEVESNAQSRDSNVRLYKNEAKRLGLKIVPPDINKSGESYDVADEKTIVIGFKAIKGLGDSAVGNILKAREDGPFGSFAEFLYRTDSRLVRKDSIQALAKAGAFDSVGITRKAAFTYYQDVRQKANKFGAQKAEKGIDQKYHMSGFEFAKEDLSLEWDKKELLQYENEVLGEFISGTINDVFNGHFTDRGVVFSRVRSMPDKVQVYIEAVVADVVECKFKSGKNRGKVYARYSITDVNGEATTMTVWNESYLKHKSRLIVGRPFKAMATINEWQSSKSLVLLSLEEK